MAQNTLPKSLHTVTVIMAVARLLAIKGRAPASQFVPDALQALGYGYETPDMYQLAEAARRKLEREEVTLRVAA